MAGDGNLAVDIHADGVSEAVGTQTAADVRALWRRTQAVRNHTPADPRLRHQLADWLVTLASNPQRKYRIEKLNRVGSTA